MLPKPEEVPKKSQSLEVKILPKPVEVPKNQKKQSFGGLGLGGLKNFGFFGTSSGFGKIFTSRLWFFGTPSGSGNIFLENLAKTFVF